MVKRSVLCLTGGAALLLLLVACGQSPAAPQPDPSAGQAPIAPTTDSSPAAQLPTNLPVPQVSVEPAPSPVENTGEVPDAVLQAMIADLVARQGVDAAGVVVRVAEAITWPDGAMGCPQPGAAYTQALIDGYRVVLEVGGAEYAYHGSVDGAFMLCERPALRSRP